MGVGYLEKGLSCFTKVSTDGDNEVEVDAKELEPISDFKEEKINKKNL